MLMPIIAKSTRDDHYAILAADSRPIALEEALVEWRANLSAQELQETEDHPVYAEFQVKQLHIEG